MVAFKNIYQTPGGSREVAPAFIVALSAQIKQAGWQLSPFTGFHRQKNILMPGTYTAVFFSSRLVKSLNC